MDEQMQNNPQPAAPQMNPQSTGSAPSGQSSGEDQSKLWGILGYIFGILFFIPLVTDLKNNAYSRFHANQQLILLICWVAKTMIFWMLAFSSVFLGFWSGLGVGSLLSLISFGLSVVLIIFMILGIISASKGEMKPLPIIGGIKIIK